MEIVRPRGLDEALEALDAYAEADVLAGGTDLMVEVNLAHRRPTTVVSLRRVPELLEWDDRWIGAGVTYRRMEHDGALALAELARAVGSPQIRTVGTLGGNLGTASPAGDTLPYLAALDATIVLRSVGETRRLAWNDFLLGPKHTARRPDELILGVELPELMPVKTAFSKIGIRQAMVISIVSCCVARFPDGSITVALGAVAPTVMRARRAEQLVSDDPSALEEFQRVVAEEVRPITDHRSTEHYRRHAAGVLARRALERVL